MRYLHTMVRITNVDSSLYFYCDLLGFEIMRKTENERGRYTNFFLCSPRDKDKFKNSNAPALELTFNWDSENYPEGRNFGHLAYCVPNIYELCEKLIKANVTINRPPRDGYMAFIRSPDGISIEVLQEGKPLVEAEPWKSMNNSGYW